VRDERTVLVGQAPSRLTDGGAPFSGRSGRRLALLAGVPHGRLGEVFELRNVFDRWPGRNASGADRFPAVEARLRMGDLMGELAGRRVVFVGSIVARAASFGGPLLSWTYTGDHRLAWMPHPSGRTRWYNLAENYASAAAFLRSEVERAALMAGVGRGTG
jgi:uracil-DNA glycosylase